GVPVSYVIANTSSYTYPDANRPVAGVPEGRPFGDRANCTTYNRWPYGLQERAGYSTRSTDDQLKQQLVARPATYLVGQFDTSPVAGLHASCPPMAQGPHRPGRGEAHLSCIKANYLAQHQSLLIQLRAQD